MADQNVSSPSCLIHLSTLTALGLLLMVIVFLSGCAGIQSVHSVTQGPAASPTPSATPNANATTFVYATETFLGPGNLVTLNTKDGSMSQLPIPGGPEAVAATSDGKRVYVAEAAAGSIAVVDTQSNAVVGTIAVGKQPNNIVFTPDGRFAYVANMFEGTVSVIDTSANAVVNTIFTDSAPAAVTFSSDGRKAYVTLLDFVGAVGGPHHENALLVIDTASQQIINRIPLLTGTQMASSPTHHEIYIVESPMMSVLDTQTDQVVAQIKLDNDQTTGVAVSPDGNLIYITEHGMVDIGHETPPLPTVPSTVYVISAAQRTVLAKAQTAPGLSGISLTPDGRTAYVISDETSIAGIQAFDTATMTFGPLQSLGGVPNGVAVGSH